MFSSCVPLPHSHAAIWAWLCDVQIQDIWQMIQILLMWNTSRCQSGWLLVFQMWTTLDRVQWWLPVMMMHGDALLWETCYNHPWWLGDTCHLANPWGPLRVLARARLVVVTFLVVHGYCPQMTFGIPNNVQRSSVPQSRCRWTRL